MKRPNGYGSVINLGKGRRRPYAVRVMDYEKSYKPNPDGSYTRKYIYIGYFEKKADAYEALDNFNASKTPAVYVKMTFADIWAIWSKTNLSNKSKSRETAYLSAYKKCALLHDRPIVDLRLHDLQAVIDNSTAKSLSSLNQIKIVMGFIFEWALKNDIIEKDYSKFVEIHAPKQENHIPLTHLQFDTLMGVNEPNIYQKMAIVYLFTGTRFSELRDLKKEDVHIKEQYMQIRKAKTRAGVRLVPIADKIVPVMQEFMGTASDTLFDVDYQIYRAEFTKMFPGLTPHSTRTTFVSFLTEKDVPQIIIKKIVGHTSGDVTADVYTKLSLAPLLEAVNKL